MDNSCKPFKTSDGVEINQGDSYWYVAVGNGGILKKYCTKYVSWQDYNKGRINFSTEALADDYLKDHK